MSRNNWPDQKAYATTNENEYLGEATEAYFGTNDLYRYVISELRRHDPRTFNPLQKPWGTNQPRPGDRPRIVSRTDRNVRDD